MSQTKWPLGKMVEVDWVDSAFCRGWQDTDEKRRHQGIVTCRSVGYLLASDKKQIRLVGSQADNDSVADGMSIPRAAVTRMRVIGRVK